MTSSKILWGLRYLGEALKYLQNADIFFCEASVVMRNIGFLVLLYAAETSPALTQNKIEDRMGQSAEVLRQILSKPDAIPQEFFNKSVCVLLFPGVKRLELA
jgi:hypothetical protein